MARAEVKVIRPVSPTTTSLSEIITVSALRWLSVDNYRKCDVVEGRDSAFTDSLKHLPDSSEKAATQNNLGLALGELAKRETTLALRDAKKAFEEALDLSKQHSHEFDAAPGGTTSAMCSWLLVGESTTLPSLNKPCMNIVPH